MSVSSVQSARAMVEEAKPKAESLNGARIRFLFLGLIIGASAIVLVTNSDGTFFGTAAVMDHAMPATSSVPGAIASAVMPRSTPVESARIPEIDVSRLPKAAPEKGGAVATKRGSKKTTRTAAEGEEKKAAGPLAPPTPAEESTGLPPMLEQVLDGLGGISKGFGKDE